MPSGFVYVLALEEGNKKMKKRTQRGVFLLIFDHGNVISRDTSLIVIWDERGKDEEKNELSQFDYILPAVHQRQIKEAVKKKESDGKALIKKLELEQAKKSKKMTMGKIRLLAEAATIISFENLEAFSLRFHKGKKRASNNFSVFDIEMALENGGGRWRKFPADSFNSRLRDKYLVIPNAKGKAIKNTRTYQQWASAHRKFLLGEILLDGRKIESDYMRVIDHSACQLSMGLVLHPHFDIKKDKNPSLDDPLSIVRSFLRFIGVYLETRGSGSSTSKIRDASPRYKAVLKDLRQYMVRSNVIAGKIPLPVIRRLFKKHYPNPPTDDQITKIIEDLPKIFPKEQAE